MTSLNLPKSRAILARLLSDEKGSIVVEFAFLGPALIVMVMGVLQVGIALQNYNALRNVSADVARYAMVQHQTGNNLSDSQVQTFAVTQAQGAPYLLQGERVSAQVAAASTQRVTGARELEITVNYQVKSLLDFAGIDGPFISHTRPIFLLDNTAS